MNVNDEFHSKGVLLVLNSPPGMEFGMDNMSWKIGSKFKGIKMIPLGIHIICYSLQEEKNMFKMSKFISFSVQQRIHVYKWNQVYECLEAMKGQEADGYRAGVRQYHFDSYLGAYPAETLPFWQENTKFINQQVLAKLDPVDRIAKFSQEYGREAQQTEIKMEGLGEDIEEELEYEDNERQEAEAETQNNKKQSSKFKDLIDTVYYSEIPRILNASPQSISKANLDRSEILNRVIEKQWAGNRLNLLGQIQYSFIHFLIGEELQSFSQWKKMLHLLVYSENLYSAQNPNNNTNFGLEFIAVLYLQLVQFPKDFFIAELSKDSFMSKLLGRLKEYASEQNVYVKIRKRLNKLVEVLEFKFGWIDAQSQEDEPVVIDLQSEQYF